jgi:hypothetical protein
MRHIDGGCRKGLPGATKADLPLPIRQRFGLYVLLIGAIAFFLRIFSDSGLYRVIQLIQMSPNQSEPSESR